MKRSCIVKIWKPKLSIQLNKLCLLLCLFTSAVFVNADNGDTSAKTLDSLAKFSDTLLSVKNMSGDFKQSIYDANGEMLQETEGKFSLKRPGYFLWHVAPPYEQVIIGSPEDLKVYDPDLEQMTIHAHSSLVGTPASLISGEVAEIEKAYNVVYREKKGRDVFSLSRKGETESAFTALNFIFKPSKKGVSKLEEMSFIDKLGQKTEVVLSQQKTNKKMDDAAFHFIPPEGTDIIVDG